MNLHTKAKGYTPSSYTNLADATAEDCAYFVDETKVHEYLIKEKGGGAQPHRAGYKKLKV